MFSSQSPFHPHHLPHAHGSSSSPAPFLLDSASPFFSQPASPAMSMSSPSSSAASGSRNRALVACDYCRHRKIKCDTNSPCVNCTRTKRVCQYTEVSDDANRAARERKAAAKAMKIQSLGLVGGASPRSARGISSAPSSASNGSKPSTPLLEGWSPSPASSAPSTPFTKRPFPSVLQSTPLHAAYRANLARSQSDCPTSPAEDHTYFHLRQRDRSTSSNTPPRSRSPSPEQYAFAHTTPTHAKFLPPPAGYTSYFPPSFNDEEPISASSSVPQWSPAMSSTSTGYTHSAPYTPMMGQSPFPSPGGFSKSFHSARFPPTSPPLSPEQGVFPPCASFTTAYPSASAGGAFYMPPSPSSATSTSSSFSSMQMSGGGGGVNVGLGLALPAGFAPDMPIDEGLYEQELAQEEAWARGGVNAQMAQEPEVIVFQGWGTA